MEFDFVKGEVILIDKPLEWTSFDVVKKIRNTIRIKKIGHAGTLDPLASGLLILCTGKKTKDIDNIQQQEKEYIGQFIIGATTPSYDMETAISHTNKDLSNINLTDLNNITKKFTGEILQVPPIYSAIKIDGERLYKKARKGESVVIAPRTVFIKEFTIVEFSVPIVKFRVVCSKGTYIRSLVHDFGQAINVGAYLSSLRRVRIGEYNIASAFQLNDFTEKVLSGRAVEL